jgi:hypothetical protein
MNTVFFIQLRRISGANGFVMLEKQPLENLFVEEALKLTKQIKFLFDRHTFGKASCRI